MMQPTAEQDSRTGFLDSNSGKAVKIAGLLIVVACAFWYFGGGSPGADASANRMYICSDTNRPFKVKLKPGLEIPVKSPFSGKMTGYPAEECYWTTEGSIKKEPTYVLVKKYLGEKEETFCPDCGRLVSPHNPPAVSGHRPPMTAAEYKEYAAHRRGPVPSRDEQR